MISAKKLALFSLAPIIAFPLNIDIAVIPHLTQQTDLNFWIIFFIAAPLATIEIPYWYWFWGQIPSLILEISKVRETYGIGKNVWSWLMCQPYFVRAVYNLENIYKNAIHPDNQTAKKMRKSGYLILLLLGAEPYPMGRVPAIIICRIKRWKKGLITLMVGNIFHVAIAVLGWQHLPGTMFFLLIAMILGYLFKIAILNSENNKKPLKI